MPFPCFLVSLVFKDTTRMERYNIPVLTRNFCAWPKVKKCVFVFLFSLRGDQGVIFSYRSVYIRQSGVGGATSCQSCLLLGKRYL